jgi:hypothetical protein
MTIIIDSITYDVNCTSLKRTADFLDRYAERTQDGVLHRELIGVYFNYKLQLAEPSISQLSAYQALWAKLTEAVEFHTVTVPGSNGYNYTFTAYFSGVSDELEIIRDTGNYWKNLTVNFIAQSPAVTA